MILHLYFRIKIIVFTIILTSISSANGSEDIEAKVKKLTLELRCMTCQNQSVYDSEAEFSNDIKKIVREKFNEGNSDYEIKKFLVDRYGEYILFRPLINLNNLFLWAFPFILLTIGLFFLVFKTRKR